MTIHTGTGTVDPNDPNAVEPGFYGEVQIAGSLTGVLEFSGGPVRPGGPPDAVIIGGSLTGQVLTDASLGRNLVIGGNVSSTFAGPPINVGGDASAEIQVYGSLYDDPNQPYEVWIGAALRGAFVVDFDGYDPNEPNDVWDPNAVVYVQQSDPNDPESPPATYNGNTPAARVYWVTTCVGDMDNWGDVDFPDINPFIMAFNDVIYNTSNYAAAFPGLEGSMLYHTDADCSGQVDFADINAFVARVTSGDCECGGSRGEGMDSMPPAELATLLAANVAPALYDTLLGVVEAAVGAAPDEETQAYWQAVYAALTQ